MSFHYLDDFILVAKNYSEALSQKNTLTTVWEKLGVPMEVSKLLRDQCGCHQVTAVSPRRQAPSAKEEIGQPNLRKECV